MDTISDLLMQTTLQVATTFLHNWPFLIVSVLIAVALKLYVNPDRVAAFLMRYRKVGVVGATVAAVTTPLCSCGTTAIILGMMANMMPWAPIIVFMVASPLTSPEGLIYSAGLFGWPFGRVVDNWKKLLLLHPKGRNMIRCLHIDLAGDELT